jgi:hypothetical protein
LLEFSLGGNKLAVAAYVLTKGEGTNEESSFEYLGSSDADGTEYSTVGGRVLPPPLALLSLPSLLRTTTSASLRLLWPAARIYLLRKFSPEPGDFNHEALRLGSGCRDESSRRGRKSRYAANDVRPFARRKTNATVQEISELLVRRANKHAVRERRHATKASRLLSAPGGPPASLTFAARSSPPAAAGRAT